MDQANHKRQGLLKRKLAMSFYRAAAVALPKPAAANYSNHHPYHTSKVKPLSHSLSASSTTTAAAASVGFIVNHDSVTPPQLVQKISFAPPDNIGRDASYCKFENLYADETVDLRASSYISCVQERFRLD